jgi:hypothetical protein
MNNTMASGRKVKGARHRQRKRSKRNLGPLVASRFYAPLLGMWGALLAGGSVMVLPPALVHAATEGTLIGTFDMPTQTVIAGGLALVLGIALYAPAAARSAAARRRLHPISVLASMSRRVRPIDPVRDLGSKSLDDPIETMPFATPAWRDADVDAPHSASEPVAQPAPVQEAEAQPLPRFMRHAIPEVAPAPAPAPQPAMASHGPAGDMPQELDLAAFAELPGRNAVWVEEAPAAAAPPIVDPAFVPTREADEPAAAPSRPAAPPPPAPGTAALARLRAVPASELSMIEMVERFAGALHEHRAASPARNLPAAELAAREAALAEALKALAALTSSVPASPVADADAPMRAALSQLHPQRMSVRAH